MADEEAPGTNAQQLILERKKLWHNYHYVCPINQSSDHGLQLSAIISREEEKKWRPSGHQRMQVVKTCTHSRGFYYFFVPRFESARI